MKSNRGGGRYFNWFGILLLPKSARGLAHSKTLREFLAYWFRARVLECGGPAPLFSERHQYSSFPGFRRAFEAWSRLFPLFWACPFSFWTPQMPRGTRPIWLRTCAKPFGTRPKWRPQRPISFGTAGNVAEALSLLVPCASQSAEAASHSIWDTHEMAEAASQMAQAVCEMKRDKR